jgi:hypothetical protein
MTKLPGAIAGARIVAERFVRSARRQNPEGRMPLTDHIGVFLIAGMANPSPDPLTMVVLGGACALLVEAAELIVWSNDRRRTRLHPDPYTGLADDELSPLPSVGQERG